MRVLGGGSWSRFDRMSHDEGKRSLFRQKHALWEFPGGKLVENSLLSCTESKSSNNVQKKQKKHKYNGKDTDEVSRP